MLAFRDALSLIELMSTFRPKRILHTHEMLSAPNNCEDVAIYALRQFASVELVPGEARKETPANKSMHVKASAARIFNEKTVDIRTHRPAPLADDSAK